MKILVLTGNLSLIGGIEKYNQDLITSLKAINSKILIVQRNPGNFLEKFIFFIKSFYFYNVFKPEYIICTHINFSLILLILKFFTKIRYSMSIYGIEAIPKFSFVKRTVLNSADKILTISNYTKNLIIKQNFHYNDKIFILKSCIDESLFEINKIKTTLKNKLGINKKKVILTLSRLSSNEEKGHDRVLKSLEILDKKFPNFIYLIVGGGNDTRVDKILKDNDALRKKVKFIGSIPNHEKIDYYSIADVFILPSKNEGFAIVFLEALASGLTVIAPNKYGCPEGLLNGDLGILIDEDRYDLIANAIHSVFSKKINKNLIDKNFLRNETKKIYGIQRWNSEVTDFYNMIRYS